MSEATAVEQYQAVIACGSAALKLPIFADVRCVCGHKRKHHEESDGGTEPRWLACKGFKPEETR